MNKERSIRPPISTQRPGRSNLSEGPTLTESQFDWIAERVKSITGISLPKQKHLLVQSRILKRLKALDIATFDGYISHLKGPKGEQETVAFCNVLTTNLTSFFREMHHFEHLKRTLREPGFVRGGSLNIWSAGCSTGQEPYSIAMTLLSVPEMSKLRDLSILATDIDTNVLAKAKEGTYRSSDIELIPSAHARNFQQGAAPGQVRVRDNVRSAITFKHANLMQNFPAAGSLDVIFCRNVVIYFDPPTKHATIKRLASCLKIGGVLYLGHSESIQQPHDMLELAGQTTFRRYA